MTYLTERNRDGSKNKAYEPFVSLGEELEVLDAPEPSDIIWENL
jgi:hypothetical protein